MTCVRHEPTKAGAKMSRNSFPNRSAMQKPRFLLTESHFSTLFKINTFLIDFET